MRRRSVTLACLSVILVAAEARGFPRTETRAPCAIHNPLRNPYFGDTHVHTAFSFDANVQGVRNTPRDAYRFARGEAVGIPPYDRAGTPLRRVQLRRPLDFTAVTDHAELLGETHICQTPGAPGYDSLLCRIYRRWPLLTYYIVNSRIFNVSDPLRYSFCGAGGRICLDAAAVPWREIQQAANDAYDRTAACRFTAFVGYEWSGNPDSNMIHRNVIFRNAIVPAYPTSYVDEPHPEGLWRQLHAGCLDLHTGCDVLTIPHNSNLSSGWLFQTESLDGQPMTRAQALERAELEPLVEVLQHKGDSECLPGGATEDELCAFEKLPYAKMDQKPLPFTWTPPPQQAFVRAALGAGLLQAERLGVNPFAFGLIASTDTHLGTPGMVDESTYVGHAAGGGSPPRVEIAKLPDAAIEFNPGGLAVLWAEENSRDALFEAMRRREAYGTSGPRIVVRFFGAWDYARDMCDDGAFVERGYTRGVPMGGNLPPRSSVAAPTFALWAAKDPGVGDSPGTLLQRLQIVKLWVAGGETQERVYEVAGTPHNHASVDARTCQGRGSGFDSLCTVWRDPEFDPTQRAAYYARVVENPSCRWSTYVCNAHGVDCTQPSAVPRALQPCCDETYPRAIQERAWTSPIWYTPDWG